MKLRVMQTLFVALFLCFAALIVHKGRPHLRPATQQPHFLHFPVNPFAPAKSADSAVAVAAVRAQLMALKRGDFAAASLYQSSGLHKHFGSVSAFRHMMQMQYPQFLHFQAVSFGGAGSSDGDQHIMIPVTFQTASGRPLQALYILVREDKSYKVQGVMGNISMPPVPPNLVMAPSGSLT